MPTNPFIAPLEYAESDLLMRAYRPGDGAALRRAVTASYAHLRPWMPWAKPEQSLEEAEQTCRHACARYLLGEDFWLGLWMGDELVGGTGFHLRHGGIATGNAEIGMWISAARAGQGLGTRALVALLAWGFRDWPWQRLVWRCDTRNEASARLARRGGLTLEGALRSDSLDVEGMRRSTYVFAVLREEYGKAEVRSQK